MSGNFNQTDGIMVGNSMERVAGRISLDHNISKIFEVGGNINIIRTGLDRVSSDNAFSNPLQLNALPPIQALYDTDGRYNSNTVYYNNLIELTDAF
ncbi:MAG TPA: hypothetical protein VGD90_12820, partial [Sphingobacteriaceae bacterium]